MSDNNNVGFAKRTWVGIIASVIVAAILSTTGGIITRAYADGQNNIRMEQIESKLEQSARRDKELTEAVVNLRISTARMIDRVDRMENR